MAYVPATPATLKLRFPAFAGVDDATLQYWIDDARLIVTDAWADVDRANAEMSLAAHNLTLNGYGSAGGAVGDLAAMGVTSFKSASMSVNFAEGVIASGAAGGYGATKYGKDFQVYLRRNRGGPRLAGCA